MRRTLLITTALALSALTLSGCSAGMDNSSSESAGGFVESTEARSDGAFSMPADGAVVQDIAAEGVAGDNIIIDTGREVITTGYMSVTVTSPDKATTEAIRITEAVGGRVDGRNEYAPYEGNRGSSTLTLRIPASALTETLEKFKELGTLQEVSTNAQDVTMQSRDLDARITALEASVERLLALLTTATDTETLIQLETAISSRQGELESMKSQKRYFDDQVSMSTLTLSLISEADAPSVEPDSFLDGLIAGWNSFVAFFAGLLVVAGVLVPWFAFLAIIAGVIALIVRSKRRSRAAAATAVAVETMDDDTSADTAATADSAAEPKTD